MRRNSMDKKKQLHNYKMNNVDVALGLIDNTDSVELNDDLMSYQMKLIKDIETFYDMLEKEEEVQGA